MATTSHPLVVAALGDSFTDEYPFTLPQQGGRPTTSSPNALPSEVELVGLNSARNWVLNLAAARSRQVTFGAYSTADRGATRHAGFAEDWALVGATAADDVNGNNLNVQYEAVPGRSTVGLLTQSPATSGFRPRDVDVVTIEVGVNDYARSLFNYVSSAGQINDYVRQAQGQPSTVNAGIEGAIKTAVGRIHATIPHAKIVIITPPNSTTFPQVESGLSGVVTVLPHMLSDYANSLQALGSDMATYARSHHLGLVNMNTLFDQRRSQPDIAGIPLDYQASGQDMTDGFVGDGYHPGTLLQGTLAQAIVKQIDALYGRNVITPLTDTELVAYAQATQTIVALTSRPSAHGPNATTLQAAVVANVGNTTPPTGTVTFEAIVPASTDEPAHFGTILGVVPVNPLGFTTLDVPTGALIDEAIYAVYDGDESDDGRISNVLPGTKALTMRIV